MTPPPAHASAAQKLCPQCGLCCRGALFADVALETGEDAAALAKLGLEFVGRSRRFRQPCNCFDGQFCRIYAARPNSCRTFECRLLQRTQQGEVSLAKAEKIMATLQRDLRLIDRLTSALGETNARLPLMQRYARVLAEPLDLAGDRRQLQQRAQLMRAVHRLTQLLEKEFLS